MPRSKSFAANNGDLDEVKSQSASTTASSGTKRKRADVPKFYTVREGFNPGIYHSWADCKAQITGFKGAIFKSFTSLHEAEAFLRNEASNANVSKYYAVQCGRNPGVYTDWPSVQEQITGWKAPKHKSFPTRAEAETFVAAGRSAVPSEMNEYSNGDVDSEISIPDGRKGCKVSDRTSKKMKKNDGTAIDTAGNNRDEFEPGTGPLPPDAEDGFERIVSFNPLTGNIEFKNEEQLSAVKMQPTGEMKGVLHIYTDGSSLGNGQTGAIAGVGVWFGKNDPRNVSEPLTGVRQTNQRAELTALQRALDIAPIDRSVRIFSDSNYAIKCVTHWFQKWRENQWKNAAGKSVENKDIIEPIVQRISERHMCKARTDFTWLKGHANDEGNNAADQLAVAGAHIAQALTLDQDSID